MPHEGAVLATRVVQDPVPVARGVRTRAVPFAVALAIAAWPAGRSGATP